MTVRVFKLINGEELISSSKMNIQGNAYVLDKPAVIMIQQTEQGVGVGVAPYMPYAQGEVTLYLAAIASEGLPDVKMENEYSRIFGSGIQLASAGGISGL